MKTVHAAQVVCVFYLGSLWKTLHDVYDLVGGAVTRITPLTGRAEHSLESFAETPEASEHPMLAFTGAGGHVPLVWSLNGSCYSLGAL